MRICMRKARLLALLSPYVRVKCTRASPTGRRLVKSYINFHSYICRYNQILTKIRQQKHSSRYSSSKLRVYSVRCALRQTKKDVIDTEFVANMQRKHPQREKQKKVAIDRRSFAMIEKKLNCTV